MLREMQLEFIHDLFLADKVIPVTGWIKATDKLSATEQFLIYRGSVFGILSKALSEIYPVCLRLVGHDFFDGMAQHFISRHPSWSPDLNDYGSGLPGFMEGFPPTQGLPYLPDVARLEWAWHRALNAPDIVTNGLGGLAQIDERLREQIVFQLPPNSTLLQSDFPILHIWRTNLDGQEPETIDIDAGGGHLLIWRQGLSLRVDPLDEAERFLLLAVQREMLFGEMCLKFTHEFPGHDVGELLAGAISRGWISGFRVSVQAHSGGE